MLKDYKFQKTARLIYYLLLIFSIVVSVQSYARAEEAIGKFSYVEGTVDVLRKGLTPALSVKVGDLVFIKDIIRTKSDSKAEIAFKDGNILRLAQRSRIDISEYISDETKVRGVMKLQRGRAEAIVDKKTVDRISISGEANRFEIQTPNAVAGVRGTDYFIDFENNVTKVLVKDGKVYILNPKFPNIVLTVEAGQISWVTLDKSPEPPRPATDREKEWYEKEIGPKKGAGGLYPLQTANLYDLVLSWLQEGGITLPFDLKNYYPPITETYPQLLSEQGLISLPSLWTSTPVNPYPQKEDGFYSLGTTQFWITGFGYPPDGGAYYKSLGGIVINDNMEGNFVGLYIDPSGNAGFIKSDESFTGTRDPNTNTFEISGGIYPEYMVSSTELGISAENLEEYIWYGLGSVKLFGSFATGGSIINPVAMFFNTRSIATQPWGIYDFTDSGTFSNPNAESFWTAKMGGSAEFGAYKPTDSDPVGDSGYWLGDITGDTWSNDKITGSFSGRFITPTKLGTIQGDVLGTYTGNTWQAVSLGAWSGTPLKFVSDVKAGRVEGLLGGIESLWTGNDPRSILFMGKIVKSGNATGNLFIWYSPIFSYNYINSAYTTYDDPPGAYYGFIGGANINSMEAKFNGLYIDPTGNAGYLKGDLTGTAYPGIEMFEMDGKIERIEMQTTIGIDPGSLIKSISKITFFTENGADFTLNGFPMGISRGYNKSFTYQGDYCNVNGTEWGISNTILSGSYRGLILDDNWHASIAYKDETKIFGQDIVGTKWSNHKIVGKTTGHGADISSTPKTWISVGETLGTFNPATYTFQTVIMGPWIETNKFLAMANTNAGKESLQKLNIPCVEVGKVNMSGSGNNLTVNMNDVKFFAPTTGGRPSIWATGNVNGSYSGNPVVGVPVGISGNGLSTNFTVQQWTNNKWLSTITNGIGSITGGGSNVQNLNFNGAGAGTYNGGSFSGTAAGVAK